jgi:hypothetical protein
MLHWNVSREMAGTSKLYIIILIMLRGGKLLAILGYTRSVRCIVVDMTSFKLQCPIRKQCTSYVEIDMPPADASKSRSYSNAAYRVHIMRSEQF